MMGRGKRSRVPLLILMLAAITLPVFGQEEAPPAPPIAGEVSVQWGPAPAVDPDDLDSNQAQIRWRTADGTRFLERSRDATAGFIDRVVPDTIQDRLAPADSAEAAIQLTPLEPAVAIGFGALLQTVDTQSADGSADIPGVSIIELMAGGGYQRGLGGRFVVGARAYATVGLLAANDSQTYAFSGIALSPLGLMTAVELGIRTTTPTGDLVYALAVGRTRGQLAIGLTVRTSVVGSGAWFVDVGNLGTGSSLPEIGSSVDIFL